MTALDLATTLPAVTTTDVDVERDARIAHGLQFEGNLFQTRPADLVNIAGAGTLAGFAMARGAQPGDLRWHGGQDDFGWIAMDNSVVAMDAQTTFGFAQAAANRQAAHIFAARALKDASPIPLAYRSDAYWPA